MSQTRDLKSLIQWTGLVAGPSIAIIVFLFLPSSYHEANGQLVEFALSGRMTLSVMVWMAIWWLTEPIHISATALLPILLLPILGATSLKDAASPYAHPLVYLVMGGFLIALTMQKWRLDRRMALLTLNLVGSNPINMVGGIMAITAVLSAFVSNTATAAMMLPIALSIIELYHSNTAATEDLSDDLDSKNFALCALLGLAYAASIGGIATIIGTGPNSFLVGFIDETIAHQYRSEISFANWLVIGVPLTAIFLPITWFLLTRVIFPLKAKEIQGGHELIKSELAKLGSISLGEKLTFMVFILAAALWTFRPLIAKITIEISGQAVAIFQGLTDTGIAMLAVMILFVLPVDIKKREFALDWQTAVKIPWGILLLFGGGLSLSEAVQNTGVAEFIASQARHFDGLPTLALVVLVTAAVIFLTELTSNVATTTTLLPILAALAPGLGIHPYMLIVPATLAASCAFMLPVATPPNAIVFGSGEITMPEMMKAGIWLNLLGIVLITFVSTIFVPLSLSVK